VLADVDGKQLAKAISAEKKPRSFQYVQISAGAKSNCQDLNHEVALAMLKKWTSLTYLGGLNTWLQVDKLGGLERLLEAAEEAGLTVDEDN